MLVCLTTPLSVGMFTNMEAGLIRRVKREFADGAILEMVIWKLPEPEPDPDRPHGLKYRFYYGKNGRRLVGYDNERGKGDHRHVGKLEESYHFTTIKQLVADFLADVARMRN